MRGLMLIAMFAASLAWADRHGYIEARDLELAADGITGLDVEAGAGSLVITGDASLDRIVVTATINVPDKSAADARAFIDESLKLSLQQSGDTARLEAGFDDRGWNWFHESPTVDLDVKIPQGVALKVVDGSGSIRILQAYSDVFVEDGSGSLLIEDAKSVVVEDGSGSVHVRNVEGDVMIDDGSGSVTVEHVGGSVRVDDGSGGITVDDVAKDLIIIDDGSGGLDATNVRGDVVADS